MSQAKYKPIIEYCGGTEIGGGFVTGSMLQPQSLSAFSTPAMGCKIIILDDHGHPLVSTKADLVVVKTESSRKAIRIRVCILPFILLDCIHLEFLLPVELFPQQD
jgi:acyl-coenzyme A synthetase/AMP-(fatty) acid ligase